MDKNRLASSWSIDSHWEDLTKMYGNKTEYVGVATRLKLAAGLNNLKGEKKIQLKTY